MFHTTQHSLVFADVSLMSCPNLSTSRCMVWFIWTRWNNWTTCGIAAYYSWIWHTKKKLLRLTGCLTFRLTARQLNKNNKQDPFVDLERLLQYKWNDKWWMFTNLRIIGVPIINHFSFHFITSSILQREKKLHLGTIISTLDPLRNPPIKGLVVFSRGLQPPHPPCAAPAVSNRRHICGGIGRHRGDIGWVREPRASASCLSAHPWKAREDRLEGGHRENTKLFEDAKELMWRYC